MTKDRVRVVRSCGEVAAACNVSRRTVSEWCKNGLVACTKTPGGVYRIEVDETGWPLGVEEER